MWAPFFFGVIPTYGVLPYAMIVNSGSVCMSTIGKKWLLHGQVLVIPTYGVLPYAMIVNSGSVCMSTIGKKWLLHGQVLFCIPVVI